MKKFRDRVWISDEDYDLVMNIPYGRKMTAEEQAAFKRSVDKYWQSFRESAEREFTIIFVTWSLLCALAGVFMGYLIWGGN
jgi:hypothetical protein